MKSHLKNQMNALVDLSGLDALQDTPEALDISRRNALRYGMGGVAGVLLALASGGAFSQAVRINTNRGSTSVETLKNFLQNVDSLRADFKQIVDTPQSEQGKSRTQESSGTFTLLRPNQFRFDYTQPYEQQIISDGKTLWLYDVDLEQVTQKSYNEAVGSTPAALLAGGADATMAQENFTLTVMPDADGMQWVKATPKEEEGQIRHAEIGFENGMLAALVIVDNFGQKSTLKFSRTEINPKIAVDTFAFKIPDGVDLITQ